MHHLHPVVQAVDDQPPHHRVVGVERVAGAREVGIAAGPVVQVVDGVVQPAQAEGGAALVAFGGVVVDHVEDHLDAGAVQRLDHVAEFVEHRQRPLRRGTRGGVAHMRRKERDRRIAPVVDQAGRRVLRVELEHRHQLDRGDAQVDQVRDLVDQPGIGAAPGLGHAAARVLGEATNVQFVDHGLGERPAQRAVALPVVMTGVGHHALEGLRMVGTRQRGGGAPVVGGHGDGATIRVEQRLVAIETQAAGRVDRALGAPGIQLSGRQAGHAHMPVVAGAVLVRIQRHHPRRLGVVDGVVEQQLQRLGMVRIDAEADTAAIGHRPQRKRPARRGMGAGVDLSGGAPGHARIVLGHGRAGP